MIQNLNLKINILFRNFKFWIIWIIINLFTLKENQNFDNNYLDRSEKADLNSNSKPFATRSVFASILPQEFTLGDIFDEFIEEDNLEENKRYNEPDQQRKFINTKWRLSYIICYNKQHYIAFVRSQKCWYICEDFETNLCDLLLF